MAVSPGKTLLRVLFEVPFDFDRFQHVNSAISVNRELDYTVRANQLL
jgi:hypothetical protein